MQGASPAALRSEALASYGRGPTSSSTERSLHHRIGEFLANGNIEEAPVIKKRRVALRHIWGELACICRHRRDASLARQQHGIRPCCPSPSIVQLGNLTVSR